MEWMELVRILRSVLSSTESAHYVTPDKKRPDRSYLMGHDEAVLEIARMFDVPEDVIMGDNEE